MTHPTLAVIGLSGGELLLVFVAIVVLGLITLALVLAAFFVIRSLNKRSAVPLNNQPVQPAGPAPPPLPPEQSANLAGSRFHSVNLAGAAFDDVNLSNTRFHNVDLSNVSISAAQMGGATFKHVGPPPGPDGNQARQRPVRFEEMMLCDSTFRKVDLSNVRIVDCDMSGMTIDGLAVGEMIAAYQRQLPASP